MMKNESPISVTLTIRLGLADSIKPAREFITKILPDLSACGYDFTLSLGYQKERRKTLAAKMKEDLDDGRKR